MWNKPEKVDKKFPLYGGGFIEFGRARCGGGMSVGTAPIMARVIISTSSWGKKVPEDWFTFSKQISFTKLICSFSEEKENFLPDWIRADLFEYFYYELINKKQ